VHGEELTRVPPFLHGGQYGVIVVVVVVVVVGATVVTIAKKTFIIKNFYHN
jgi:hypothetical protein